MRESIETNRLVLRLLDDSYALAVARFLSYNKDYFAPYETTKVPIYYTEIYQRNILDKEYKASLNKQYLRYYVFEKDRPDKVIGTVSFGSLTPYPYSSCIIGYRFHKNYTCRGYAKEALTAAIKVAFDELPIHRINAYIMENNIPSIKVIEALGFHYEGTCTDIIKIQDKWESHRLYALINPNKEK